MDIKVTVEPSFERLANGLTGVDAVGAVRDELYKIAFRVERFAKQLTPVDTGRLKSSIGTGMLIGRIGAMVSTNTEYAIFVHEGTKYMRARPFMAKGIDMAQAYMRGDVPARLDAEFTKAFKRL